MAAARSSSVRPFDDEGRRIGLADGVEQVAEALAVLGHLDGLDGRAQQARAGALEDAGPRPPPWPG